MNKILTIAPPCVAVCKVRFVTYDGWASPCQRHIEILIDEMARFFQTTMAIGCDIEQWIISILRITFRLTTQWWWFQFNSISRKHYCAVNGLDCYNKESINFNVLVTPVKFIFEVKRIKFTNRTISQVTPFRLWNTLVVSLMEYTCTCSNFNLITRSRNNPANGSKAWHSSFNYEDLSHLHPDPVKVFQSADALFSHCEHSGRIRQFSATWRLTVNSSWSLLELQKPLKYLVTAHLHTAVLYKFCSFKLFG